MRPIVHEESCNSARVFWLNKEVLMERILKKVEGLKEDNRIKKIVLFGSLAEGKAIPGSDVDLLIVLEDKRRIFERISEFLGYFSDLGTAIDVFPYNENELNNPIAKYALRDGRVLFERRLRKGQQE